MTNTAAAAANSGEHTSTSHQLLRRTDTQTTGSQSTRATAAAARGEVSRCARAGPRRGRGTAAPAHVVAAGKGRRRWRLRRQLRRKLSPVGRWLRTTIMHISRSTIEPRLSRVAENPNSTVRSVVSPPSSRKLRSGADNEASLYLTQKTRVGSLNCYRYSCCILCHPRYTFDDERTNERTAVLKRTYSVYDVIVVSLLYLEQCAKIIPLNR